jgi:pyrroline-5-carboxylate reductase
MAELNCQKNQQCKFGFIGYGSMGKMLINSFISSGKVNSKDIIVSTRTERKLDELKFVWVDINIASNNIEVVKRATITYISMIYN